MIGWIIFIIFCCFLLGAPIYYFKLFPKFNEKVDAVYDFFFTPEPSNLNDNSLILISIGSLTGIGIGFFISAFAGGSMFIGTLIILFGLHSLKTHWHLVKK